MNFYELAEKLRAIEETTQDMTMTGDSSSGVGNSAVGAQDSSSGSTPAMTAECGDEMPHLELPKISSAPKQADSVTMNVSMNGSGPNGISDLMKILRNIEQSGEEEPVGEPMVAPAHHVQGADAIVLGSEMEEEWKNSAPNSSGEETFDVSAVTNPPSDDFSANHGDHRLRQTGLPIASPRMHEGLVDRLQKLYNEVKTRETRTLNEGCNEDPHRHALANIIASHKHDVKQFEEAGRLTPELYEKLYDYFYDGMGYREKKHDDHEVRHAHVAHHFKHAMLTPECQTAMSAYSPKVATAPIMAYEDHDLELEVLEDKKTMSRAAKGIMKYGKKGMQALRDAEAEGKDLEPVRAKYNKYKK